MHGNAVALGISGAPENRGLREFRYRIRRRPQNQKDGLDAVLLELQGARLRVAKKRIAINLKLTTRKGKYNQRAIFAIAVVILMEGVTLAWLARTLIHR